MTRQRLPNCRPQTVLEVEHSGSVYTVGTGHYLDSRPGELFIAGARTGSDIDAVADAAVATASRPKRPTEAVPAEIVKLPCPWCSKMVQRTTRGGQRREFCRKAHKVSYNNALSKLSIYAARLMRTPGALRTWTEARVNPSPSGAEGLPRVTEGAGQQGSPSAPARDETS